MELLETGLVKIEALKNLEDGELKIGLGAKLLTDAIRAIDTNEIYFEFKDDKVSTKKLMEDISAFANTFGGILLLGVEELSGGQLSVANGGISSPNTLIKEFWDIINNPKKVSVNILSDKDVYVQEIDGKNIIVKGRSYLIGMSS